MSQKLVKIAQTFRWEMGHRLPFHSGGCENIHGHSYKLIVEIDGFLQERTGMVMDFFDLKAILTEKLRELDHSFMCSSDDEMMTSLLKDSPLKIVYVDFFSTAENIAAYFLEYLIDRLKNFPTIVRVTARVYETPEEYAEVSYQMSDFAGKKRVQP